MEKYIWITVFCYIFFFVFVLVQLRSWNEREIYNASVNRGADYFYTHRHRYPQSDIHLAESRKLEHKIIEVSHDNISSECSGVTAQDSAAIETEDVILESVNHPAENASGNSEAPKKTNTVPKNKIERPKVNNPLAGTKWVSPPEPQAAPFKTPQFKSVSSQEKARGAALVQEADRLYQQRRYSEARSKYKEATDVDPWIAHAYHYGGLCSFYLGQAHLVPPNMEKAAKLEGNREDYWHDYGLSLQLSNVFDQVTVDAYLQGYKLKPSSTRCLVGAAMVLNHMNQQSVARIFLQKVFKLPFNPSDTNRAWNQLGESYRKTVFGAKDAGEAYKNDPDDSPGNILWMLQYRDDLTPEQIFNEHVEFGKRIMKEVRPYTDWPAVNTFTKGQKLRVGIFSHEFFMHAVSIWSQGGLKHVDRKKVELVCFSDGNKQDSFTWRFRNEICSEWIVVHERKFPEAAEIIRNAKIHILVELQGHTFSRMKVFGLKPAPIIVDWIGHPDTTGLPTIDFRLTDNFCDPVGKTEHLHTEKLWRLPSGFSCYTPVESAPEPEDPPVLKNGYVSIGTFSNLAKLSKRTLSLYAKIMNSIPEAQLVLKDPAFKDGFNRHTLINYLAEQGVEEERITLIEGTNTVTEHMALYNKLDIALDTFPFNGVTTTADALYMGVPVVTLPGIRHASRTAFGILSRVGLPELIAKNEDDFVSIITELCSDIDKLKLLRTTLRAKLMNSNVGNPTQHGVELTDAFMQMWEQFTKKAKL